MILRQTESRSREPAAGGFIYRPNILHMIIVHPIHHQDP
jgi:hypothetical protein